MNPKDRAKLLAELAALEKFVQDYPVAKALFPEIVTQIQALHKKVLYEKVEDKQNGLNLNAGKISIVSDFATAAIKLKADFKAALKNVTSKEADLWITLESLKTAALETTLNSSLDVFNPFVEAIRDAITGISGDGISKADFCKEIQRTIDGQYTLINEAAINLCTSFAQIKKLNIPILDHIIDHIKSYKGDDFVALMPNFEQFCKDVDALFVEEAVLTQKTYEENVTAWLKTIQDELKSLKTDKLAGAGVHVKFVSGLINQQFASIGDAALKLVHQELEAHISSIKEDPALTVKDFTEQLNTALAGFKIPTPSVEERAALKNAENIHKQLDKIKMKEAIMGAIDINSPQFVVNQPNFKENLLQKLGDWKDGLLNSLAEGGDLVLALDACTVNGPSFKKGILDCTKIDSIHKVLNALPLEELKLRGHKDLKVFNEKWNTPWKTAIAAIDVEKNIFGLYKDDAEMLTKLYKDYYSYLPSHDHVIGILNLSVGGKIDLAMLAVKKLEKKVDKISEEVDLIKDVNNLQTMGLGYNSMINEVDLIFKNIIDAHQDYVTRVNRFSIEYSNAYEQVDLAVKDFNKASEAIKAFNDMIWGAVKSLATAVLCGTGVGLVGAALAKGLSTVGAAIAEKAIEAAITIQVDVVSSNTKLVDYPTLENNNTKPFSEYLKHQIQGEETVRKTLAGILEISGQIQTINRYIQFALDNKLSVNMEPLLKEYAVATAVLEKWLKEQKVAINNYRAASAKLNPLPNVTCNNLERNMLINVIDKQLKKVVNHTNWQTICDAKEVFRPRLFARDLILKDDFIDNAGYDSGTGDELKRLYAQPEAQIF